MAVSPDIPWWVAVMCSQVPSSRGILLLVATPEAPAGKDAEGRCRSSSAPLPPGPPSLSKTSGLAEMFADRAFSEAWEVVEEKANADAQP